MEQQTLPVETEQSQIDPSQIDMSTMSVEDRRMLMRMLGAGARDIELHNRAVRRKIANRKLNVRQKASRKANRKVK